jgi:adenylate cyclase
MTATRRLAAILAADVVGYSRMIAADEAGTLARLRAARRDVVDPLMAEFKGRVFKVMGDGLLAEFPSAVQALRCAIAIQQRLRESDGLEVRIGLHQGDVVAEGGDLLGDGVNVAARLEALAEAGGICISARVREDAAGKMPLDVEDIGTPPLKNIAQPVHVFRVRLDPPERPALALPDKPSLAVLPFNNMGGDAEQEYFVDGLVEEITTALSCIRWLFVIARNSAFTYKGRAVDVRQVGRELGVRYVLEGSVRKSGDRMRITGQLADAITGAHLWANRFDGNLADVFDLQDQITVSVAGAIEPQLQLAEIERAQHKATRDLVAYDHFLRGMNHFHQHWADMMSVAQAEFVRALELDPQYGAAYGMAALCVSNRRSSGVVDVSSSEIAEGARLARVAAITGRNDAVALGAAATTLAALAGDVDAAALLVERACTLSPNSAHAWNRAGYIKVWLGEHNAAIADFERAIRLSPLDPVRSGFLTGLAWAHFFAERNGAAVMFAERAVNDRPDYTLPLIVLAAAHALAGRIEQARSVITNLSRVAPRIDLSHARQTFSPLRRVADYSRVIEGLCLAGLPE